jgi:palmitoyl transferase
MRCILAVLACGVAAASMRASGLVFREMFASKRESLRDAIRIGDWELYGTGYAKHLPYGYEDSVRARLNETTWGGGFGRTINDEDGDRHSVFVMAFSDSHRDLQVNVGYGWQRYWNATRNFSVGGGYLAFVFSREDVANYLPVPAILPCVSARYRGVEVIGLFVPRISRDIRGDVLFLYLRVPLTTGRPAMKVPEPGRGRGSLSSRSRR